MTDLLDQPLPTPKLATARNRSGYSAHRAAMDIFNVPAPKAPEERIPSFRTERSSSASSSPSESTISDDPSCGDLQFEVVPDSLMVYDECPDFVSGWDIRGLKAWERESMKLGRKRLAAILGVSMNTLISYLHTKRRAHVRLQHQPNLDKLVTEEEKVIEEATKKLRKAEKSRVKNFMNTVTLVQSECEGGSRLRREKLQDELEKDVKQRLTVAMEQYQLADIDALRMDDPYAGTSDENNCNADHSEARNRSTTELSFSRAAQVRDMLMKERMEHAKKLIEEKKEGHKTINARLQKKEEERREVLAERIENKMERAEARRQQEVLKKSGSAYYHSKIDTILKENRYY